MAEASYRMRELIDEIYEETEPFRLHDLLISLDYIWKSEPDSRTSCRDLWDEIVDWCSREPFCNEDQYFIDWEKWKPLF